MSYGKVCLLLLCLCYLLNVTVYAFSRPIENEDEELEDELDLKGGTTRKPHLPPCNQDKLVSYLAEMQAVSPENIVNLPTKEGVEDLCKSVTTSMDSFDKYAKRCEPPAEPNLYFQLIKGIRGLYQKMCKDEGYKRDYEKHARCYRDIGVEYGDCFGPPDWQESADKKFVCNSYGYLNDCYFIKTATLCGKRAARTLSELLQSVVDKVLTVKCSNVKKEPEVRDAMVDSEGISMSVCLPLLVAISIRALVDARP